MRALSARGAHSVRPWLRTVKRIISEIRRRTVLLGMDKGTGRPLTAGPISPRGVIKCLVGAWC
jgi:hypothetical protein